MNPHLLICTALISICFSPTWASSSALYDWVLQGGTVIDPANHISSLQDVGIKDGKIAAIKPHIPPQSAEKTVSVKGLYVTPGLVDIHTHVFAGSLTGVLGGGDASVFPDGFAPRSCVTAVADAGSSGWKTFPDFKARIIDRSLTRVFAFLNIVGGGMGKNSEQDTSDMDPSLTAGVATRFPGTVVGIKTAHFEGPEWTAVDRAVQAGTLAKIPVMVDFGVFRPERPFQKLVLEKLRPGDFYTHLFHPSVPMLDAQGKLLTYLFEARKRGVLFDVGHGGASFVWSQAKPAVEQGWFPDSISTDLHTGSMNSGMKDMMNLLSKFLALHIPLEAVIRMSTAVPAGMIHQTQLGTLSVGSDADIAVIAVKHGDFGFLDDANVTLHGTEKLECEMTFRSGNIAWDLNGRSGNTFAPAS